MILRRRNSFFFFFGKDVIDIIEIMLYMKMIVVAIIVLLPAQLIISVECQTGGLPHPNTYSRRRVALTGKSKVSFCLFSLDILG